MLSEFSYTRNVQISALEATPELFEHLLVGLTEAEADFRPDPQRFTIREIMAHLAEIDEVFLGRMRRICAEDHPTLPDFDEGDAAQRHNYGATDVREQFERFCANRAEMVEFLRDRPDSDWARTALRPELGVMTLEAFATLAALHDIYHLRQIKQWRERA